MKWTLTQISHSVTLDECDFIFSKTININDIVLGIIVSEKPYVIYHKDVLE